MKQIPENIQVRFKSLLVEKAVPRFEQYYYLKWLRYYLDFCNKYQFESSNKNSLAHFIQKLRDKKQNKEQQKQASDAISLYYELGLIGSQKDELFNDKNQDFSI